MDCLVTIDSWKFWYWSCHSGRIKYLMIAIGNKDPQLLEHSKNVAFYACKLAKAAGYPRNLIIQIHIAGLLHDVGKISIDDSILNQSGPLTRKQRLLVEQHTTIGHDIVYPIRKLKRVARMIAEHHEHYDGKGYPIGLSGEVIDVGARIIAIVDAYDAMRSTRPYAKPVSKEHAIQELIVNKGTQFDAKLVDLFVEIVRHDPKIT